MGYVALYREWRPHKFADIIGQEHITRTLQNALRTNRIAHAYLFCGPRGTGKTSTAKVLAKTLNCLNGPDVEPCNRCENCTRITEGVSMDVLEIDAASNRGIDEIRDLREKVKFAPTEGKSRIYIIDEVHMLTTEAFNALLKTLEEPPAHVIFVLATTEPHKVPLTILSRCQRFDFRRIGISDMISRLATVVNKLGIKAEDETLALLARMAEGGMRDALSLLDQCISFGGKEITVEDINAMLGMVKTEILFKMAECFRNNELSTGLKLVDELVRQGKDVQQFAKDLTEYFRNLLLIEVCKDDELVPVSGEVFQIMQKQAAGLGRKRIISLIDLFTLTEREMKWTSQPRLVLELGVIKAGGLTAAGDYEELRKRIASLEEQLASGQIAAAKTPGKSPRALAKAAKTGEQESGTNKTGLGQVSDQHAQENIESGNWLEQSVDCETIRKYWPNILERIKKVRMSARAFLIEGKPAEVRNGSLVLCFPPEYGFHKEKVEQTENRTAIEQVIEEVTGVRLKLNCIFADRSSGEPAAVARSEHAEDALMEEAIRLFGGDLVETEN